VWAWGSGNDGLLGDGIAGPHSSDLPVRVPELDQVTGIRTVGYTALAIRSDGTVWAWGHQGGLIASGPGLMADAGAAAIGVPTELAGIADIRDIAPGTLTAIGVRADGSVVGWGANLTDMLGGTEGPALRIIRDVPPAAAVATSLSTAYALSPDGRVFAWGSNAHGELGHPPARDPGEQNLQAQPIPLLADIVAVAGGAATGYALNSKGSVWAWGGGRAGTLGDGKSTDHNVPHPIPVLGLPNISRISANDYTAYAIDADGGLFGWGSSFGFPAGVTPTSGATGPVRVPTPGRVLAVDGGVVLMTDR
jgi:alpha-tubulin suppressor-like RCC1 family protein